MITFMAEFDWVTARSDCSLGAIFEKLRVQVGEDVKKRQALRGQGAQYYGFTLLEEPKSVGVMLEHMHDDLHRIVRFRLAKNAIEVVDENGKVKFVATPTLNDEGECRLKIEGIDRDLWHLRKLALEELFFGHY
jgi:hypothetical protein